MENGDPFGYQGIGTGKLLLVTIPKRDGKAGLYMETEQEIHFFKSSGNGAVYPSAFSRKKLFRRGDTWADTTAKGETSLSKGSTDSSQKETDRDSGTVLFLFISNGGTAKRPKRSPYAVREDIRKLDRRIEQIEFLLKHDIITREQLAAYREPLQKQIAELMKERRRLYRNGGRETGEERLSEINEELKRLRKEVRMTVQIEKHSLEIEARLQEAEEQSQNEKRVEDKERMQKSQEVR